MSNDDDRTNRTTDMALNRRNLIAGAGALGGLAALSSTLPLRRAHASTPRKGGRFRVGVAGGSTTDSLDPGTIADTGAQVVNYQVRNNLVEILPSGDPAPELAESWEASPDARTWTFELRRDVEFHNGKTLEAADVVYSINHHRGPDTTSVATGLTDPIVDIRADGKHTVVFTLESGNADFAFGLSDYHLTIFPEGTSEFDLGMGTGAYMLEEWSPGVRAFTRRNPNYWKDGRAHFDEVETIVLNDTAARTNALLTDEVDAVGRVDLATIGQLSRRDDIEIHNIAGMRHFTLPMRTDTPPFDNNDLRLALKYAINRQEILDKVLQGYGTLGNDHPISGFNRFHADDLPQREFDPDQARFHLKRAGMEGQTFDLRTSDAAFNGAIDATVLYQASAAEAGIDINLIRETADGYWSRVWLQAPWCVSFWSGRPTEDFMFTLGYSRGAAWNATKWDHDRFNDLLVAARAELDTEKRREMYREMQLLVRDEGGVIIPIFMNYVYATNRRIATGPEQSGAFELDGTRLAERWWFA